MHRAGRLHTAAGRVQESAHMCTHVYKGVCACMCLYVPVSVCMWNMLEHTHVCVCIPLLCAGGA